MQSCKHEQNLSVAVRLNSKLLEALKHLFNICPVMSNVNISSSIDLSTELAVQQRNVLYVHCVIAGDLKHVDVPKRPGETEFTGLCLRSGVKRCTRHMQWKLHIAR